MDYIADEDVTVNRLVRSIGWIALVVPLVAILLTTQFVVYGFVLMKLWGWFLVPIGLSPIGYGMAVGLVVLLGLLHKSDEIMKKKEPGESFMYLANIFILKPLTALVAGYVVHLFIR